LRLPSRCCLAVLAACGQQAEPPGRSLGAETASAASSWLPSQVSSEAPVFVIEGDGRSLAPPAAPGATETALPKLASIAMRTWVYQEPREDAQKLGYLRAGAVVERAPEPAGTRDCAGGWYRVMPRGFVCVGKGAALDVAHPIVTTAHKPPRRGEPFPYRYVISGSPAPHLYFKLPNVEEQRYAEGAGERARSMALRATSVRAELGPADEVPPTWLGGDALPKPYGAEAPLSYRSHRGRASEASAFGLIATYDWTDRPMGLTTELDLIPLDRTKVAPLSKLRGLVLDKPGTPAFVITASSPVYEMVEGPTGLVPKKTGEAPRRSGWALTGRDNGSPSGLRETTRGVWLPAANLRIATLREDPNGFAAAGRKWIDVSIKQQLLVAYEGRVPVFATLVSTGRGELGDPEKTTATVRGAFMIASKHVSGTMDGDEQTRESFDLRDVPYIQYFHKGYALHGAFWHDDFGKVRSHGCVNLAPADAAWLFEWTEPHVPEGWHGALNPNYGTLVYTHG
jgi:hypothetical protein